MNRLLRQRVLRTILALGLLGQLAVPALALAQPCPMPHEGGHAMAAMAEHGSMEDGGAMDAADCCQDDGPCLLAHCMAPVGACAAPPMLVRLPLAAPGPAAVVLNPRAIPQRHFRPPIAA
ncbi:hypothetical protein [Pseudohaliea rubra]|uniref:CopL family metal-binding regulatory protein n=1 Tax=Pseudohaliea rubra DSM 19751 TaxID=1265313 RepID=A0A095VNL5_9GAMM|nr:hypothetical protein [Pseudohaliea rubra]KGE02970.1 hypothetical protein HRUBRA_02408 [Pseudohaliea rubra DSM 19751]